MKTATVANAKSHLSSLLADVEAGEVVVLTRRGRPIARLVPEPETACNWDALEAWVA
ncbi:MAG: type II toxin-antitoxin system prevent-host-death family antitoxin, partial [Chromatiaceae bacterium]|nr:type II toxin-antitoxin system prevent-host-death family antitoxin [Chromatiaceae bacterium]